MLFNRNARSQDGELPAASQALAVAGLPRRCSICPEQPFVAENLRELAEHRSAEILLRADHVRDVERLREMDLEIRRQALFGRESEHRLMNDLQLIVSLLSLQSRTQTNAETATQLSVAASRVAAIARIHRHLHSVQGSQTIAFKRYLGELCEEYSTMLSSDKALAAPIVVDGPEIDLPAAIGTPLGLVVNELLTNAIKHGQGQITVRFEPEARKGWALSVCNDGSGLPDDFDASARNGLGMSLVASLVEQIGGELQIERGDRDQGARFTVLFSQ